LTTEPEGVGLTREEAKKELAQLAPLYMQKIERLKFLASGPNGSHSEEYVQTKAQAEALEARMTWIRDWYSLGVWESVEKESRQLRKGIKQLNATTVALVRSSRILEALTLFLITFAALTAAYTALGPRSLFASAFPYLVLALIAVLAYWVATRLPHVGVPTPDSEDSEGENPKS
jgi:hypothetical protein